ncbi:hypothetical protein A4G99_17400 [Haladaptatus sp. R4]|uniref:MDR family MFS transporter n=1 Tax=Haladaptatus sp. R4 TaxID=1679489 RepID=UPI0007B49CAF|nr:MDR family MFS transporter [Haladaptatus sp. R4]KZN22876.1 hypothetical protein A4G99_17400 [Haladaptatus sp. R4]
MSVDDRTKYSAFVGLAFLMLLAAIDQTIVATALPSIASDLGSLDQVFWVVTSYLITTTAVTPLYGKLSDIYGRRRLTQVGIIIFLVGSILSGLSGSMLQLTLFRALQGVGGGGLMAMAVAGMGDIFTPRERGKYMSYLNLVFGAAVVGGPLVGGYITEYFTWRWIFYINVPVALLALALVETSLDVPVPDESHEIDFGGAILIVVTVTALIALTSFGGDRYAWGSWEILGLAVVTVVGTVLFVLQERRVNEPIFSFELFRNRTVVLIAIIAVLNAGARYGATNYIPLFLQTVLGAGESNAGLLLLPFLGGYVVSSMVGGQFMSRIGRYKPITIGGLVFGALGFYLLSTMSVHITWLQTTGYMIAAGLMGMTSPTLSTAIQNAVSGDAIGEVSSLYAFTRNLGGALGVAAFGIVLNRRVTTELGDVLPKSIDPSTVAQSPQSIQQLSPQLQQTAVHALADAFDAVFFFGGILLVLSVVAALALPHLDLKDESGVEGRSTADGADVDES